MSRVAVAIIGAGPYGLSLAAHLAARNVEHRIFGHPMRFWSDIAEAGGERYLKSLLLWNEYLDTDTRLFFRRL